MIYQDIILGACAAVCEDLTSSPDTADYHERATYLLASFVMQHAAVDADYRRGKGLPEAAPPACVARIDPEKAFPLSEVFVPLAIDDLAAALVIDENEEMSDKFFDRYVNGMIALRKSIPALQEKVIDKYGLS